MCYCSPTRSLRPRYNGALLFVQPNTFSTWHLCNLSPLTSRIQKWAVPFLAWKLPNLSIKMLNLKDFEGWACIKVCRCDHPRGGLVTGAGRLAPVSQTVGSLIWIPTGKQTLIVKKDLSIAPVWCTTLPIFKLQTPSWHHWREEDPSCTHVRSHKCLVVHAAPKRKDYGRKSFMKFVTGRLKPTVEKNNLMGNFQVNNNIAPHHLWPKQ